MRRRLLLFLLLWIPLCLHAYTPVLQKNHPFRYTVKPGDTLWSIAQRFLKRPWEWQSVWEQNSQISHPNDIYPGDVLEFHLLNGQPRIHVVRGSTVVLRPSTRIAPLLHPIPTIPIAAIRPFLSLTQITQKETLLKAPYIVRMVGEHLSGGKGDEIYVREFCYAHPKIYSIFRLGQAYKDPLTHHLLGYQATYVGQAQLRKTGDPAILKVLMAEKELLIGDRLLPANQHELTTHFMPHAPDVAVKANIINVLNNIREIGVLDTVVLDIGHCQGIRIGDVMAIKERPYYIADPIRTEKDFRKVRIPPRHVGQLMVYRVFDQVSYALVMNAEHAIHVLDMVTNPDRP